MGDTMPTVVAKGLIGVRLDRQYATAERRAESLMYFRRTWAATKDGVKEVAAHTKSLSDAERSLLNDQWFGAPWDGVTPLTPTLPWRWTGRVFNWWHRISYPPP